MTRIAVVVNLKICCVAPEVAPARQAQAWLRSRSLASAVAWASAGAQAASGATSPHERCTSPSARRSERWRQSAMPYTLCSRYVLPRSRRYATCGAGGRTPGWSKGGRCSRFRKQRYCSRRPEAAQAMLQSVRVQTASSTCTCCPRCWGSRLRFAGASGSSLRLTVG